MEKVKLSKAQRAMVRRRPRVRPRAHEWGTIFALVRMGLYERGGTPGLYIRTPAGDAYAATPTGRALLNTDTGETG